MKNKWSSKEAKKYITKYKKDKITEDLALRVYSTHLLGREKELVLHGGGNTSVKTITENFSLSDLNEINSFEGMSLRMDFLFSEILSSVILEIELLFIL